MHWDGRVNIKQKRNATNNGPIDAECTGPCCTTGYSRGYLRHLYMAGEMLAARVLTQHNLHFFGALMAQLRDAIRRGDAHAWGKRILDRMAREDELASPDKLPGPRGAPRGAQSQ